MRSRFAFIFALIAGLCAFALVLVAGDWTKSVLPIVREHYPWALLPLLGFGGYVAIRAYLEIGRFFQRYSEFPSGIGVVAGIVGASIAAAEWDGQINLADTIDRAFPGGLVGLSVWVVGMLFVAVVLRLYEYEYADAVSTGVLIVGVLAVTPTIYVIGHSVWVHTPWSSVVEWLGNVASRWWPLAILVVAVAVQIPGWRRHWASRTAAQLPEDSRNLGAALSRLILGGVTLALMVGVILYQVPDLLVTREGLSNAEYADAITQERRTLLAVMGALGAGVTLVYTHLRHQLDRDANATGRYTEAVQQLGNESMSIRLGGIYALARVARDSPGDRQTVTEVFAAFVRDSTRTAVAGVALDVVAALTELGKASTRESERYGTSVNLRSSNFTEGNLESVHFPVGVDLSESDLSSAILRGASMHRAILTNARMSRVDLQGAHLDGCILTNALLVGADMQDARMSFSQLNKAQVDHADLRRVKMKGCDLRDADFTSVDFTEADLRGADLRGAIMTGCELRGTRLERALLFGAVIETSALANADFGVGAIETDIRSDVTAQRIYANWRVEYLDEQTFAWPDEYFGYHDRIQRFVES